MTLNAIVCYWQFKFLLCPFLDVTVQKLFSRDGSEKDVSACEKTLNQQIKLKLFYRNNPELSKPEPRLDDSLEKLKIETLKIVDFILAQQRLIASILLPPVRVIVTQISDFGKELSTAQVADEDILQILYLED